MNENVTPESLDALEAMEKAATPRPWERVDVHGIALGVGKTVKAGVIRVFEMILNTLTKRSREKDTPRMRADADAIVAARNALPDHIAEIRRLRASVNEAITWCEQCKGLERESPMRCARCQTFVGLLAVAGAAKEESDGE